MKIKIKGKIIIKNRKDKLKKMKITDNKTYSRIGNNLCIFD